MNHNNELRASWIVLGILLSLGVGPARADSTDPAVDAASVTQLEFGRPCEHPQPAFDEQNPVDRMTRRAPHSNPATPLTQPPYPNAARRLGQEGVAIVDLLVNVQGEVSRAKLKRSTGSPMLDEAALEETRHWRLLPGTANNEPQCMWGAFAIQFELREYSAEELAAAQIVPGAESLAAVLLGVDHFEADLLDTHALPTERGIFLAARTAFLESPAWLDARRRTAAILSIEFTPAEIAELERFLRTPFAAKWRDLQGKLAASVGVEERVAAGSLSCTMSEVGRALQKQDPSAIFASDRLKPEYRDSVSSLASRAVTYCDCGVRASERESRGLDHTKEQSMGCGSQPELD